MTLPEVRQAVAGLLAEGVADKASPFRNLAVATVDGDGQPCIRTVVLRSVELDARRLCFHTDMRSAKVAQLTANPALSLHGWDPARQVQLRLAGRATLHHDDAEAATAWADLHEGTRRTYRVRLGPGTPVAQPDGLARDLSDEAAYAQFVLVSMRVDVMEWLCLQPPEHRRARFGWQDGVEHATWLVP